MCDSKCANCVREPGLLSRVKILDSYSTGFSTTIVVSILSFTIFLLILFKGDEQFSHMEL